MNRTAKFTIVGAVLACTLPFAGCQSDGATASDTAIDEMVVCETCKTAWVRRPPSKIGGRHNPVAYQWRQSSDCPDCDGAVKRHFGSGEPLKCDRCRDNLRIAPARQG